MRVDYYKTSSGRLPVLEFVYGLSEELQSEFFDDVYRLESGEILPFPTSRALFGIQKGLYELRFKDRAGIYRIFYYVKVKDSIYMLHAYKKKSQQLSRVEIETVLKRIREI